VTNATSSLVNGPASQMARIAVSGPAVFATVLTMLSWLSGLFRAGESLAANAAHFIFSKCL